MGTLVPLEDGKLATNIRSRKEVTEAVEKPNALTPVYREDTDSCGDGRTNEDENVWRSGSLGTRNVAEDATVVRDTSSVREIGVRSYSRYRLIEGAVKTTETAKEEGPDNTIVEARLYYPTSILDDTKRDDLNHKTNFFSCMKKDADVST